MERGGEAGLPGLDVVSGGERGKSSRMVSFVPPETVLCSFVTYTSHPRRSSSAAFPKEFLDLRRRVVERNSLYAVPEY